MVKYIKQLSKKNKELALKNQVLQGNEPNEELRLGESVDEGGFKWSETPEGYDYWFNVFKSEETVLET